MTRFRTYLYLLSAVPLGFVGGLALLLGWLAVLLLALTPLGVPALVAFRALTGWLAAAEAWLANRLLDTDLAPRRSSGGRWYWRRGLAVLRDRAFWLQQAFLTLRHLVGAGVGIAALAWLWAGATAVTFPLWYRFSDAKIGAWHVDSLGQAALWVVPGVVALLFGIALLGPARRASLYAAELLR